MNSGLAAELRYAVVHCMSDTQRHCRCTQLPITDSHACAGSHAGANSAACALYSEASFWQSRWNAAVSRCNHSCAQSRCLFQYCQVCQTFRCLHKSRSALGSHCVLIWRMLKTGASRLWLGY